MAERSNGASGSNHGQPEQESSRHLRVFASRNAATLAAIARVKAFAALCLACLGSCEILAVASANRRQEPDSCNLATWWWMWVDGLTTVLVGVAAFSSIYLKRHVVANTDLHVYLLEKERGRDERVELESAIEGVDMEATTSWSVLPQCRPRLPARRSFLEDALELGSFVLVALFWVGCCLYFFVRQDSSCQGGAGAGGGNLERGLLWILVLKMLGPVIATLVSLGCCLRTFIAHHPKDATIWDDVATDMW